LFDRVAVIVNFWSLFDPDFYVFLPQVKQVVPFFFRKLITVAFHVISVGVYAMVGIFG
jgi:hypothetical protein